MLLKFFNILTGIIDLHIIHTNEIPNAVIRFEVARLKASSVQGLLSPSLILVHMRHPEVLVYVPSPDIFFFPSPGSN